MGKRVRKSLSNAENCSLRAAEKTINLDSSSDSDIIECSIGSENNHNFFKNGQSRLVEKNLQLSKLPVQNKEMLNFCSSSQRRNSTPRSSKSIHDKASGETAALSFDTPCPKKSTKERNSVVKKLISTLKKTPEGPYLSVSKLRNIEQWLRENEVEMVSTPPFANLSVTPKVSKRLSSRWRKQSLNQGDSSIDSEVEGVLKAVYGEDWQQKNVQGLSKTEPKKKSKKFFSPVTQNSLGRNHRSVRRKILKDKKLNLSDKSDEENNLDESFLSGIRMINFDDSNCNAENIKPDTIKGVRGARKYEGESSDPESLYLSPVEKKKPSTLEKRSRTTSKAKTSTGKKCPSNNALKTPKKTFLASLSVSTPTSKCHPDAQYYKINFKSKKEELVKKLFKLYNSEVFDCKLPEDMNFSWNVKLRGTAGYCYNKRITKSTGEVIRISRVEFSTKIVDRADRLRDTMIHELCHAASWVIDGVLDGHGEVWSMWASRAMVRFPELPPIKRCHNYDIVSKYVYRCTSCGYSIKRHSKSINTERKRCGHCYGVLELLINKKKKGKGEVPEFNTTRTLPTPNKFAMFVKENYHTVKSTKMDAKHPEIMKILSEKYAILKGGVKSAKKNCTDD